MIIVAVKTIPYVTRLVKELCCACKAIQLFTKYNILVYFIVIVTLLAPHRYLP
jgi:hypothetical protein